MARLWWFGFIVVVSLSVGAQVRDEKLTLHASIGYGIPIGGAWIDTSTDFRGPGAIIDREDHYLNYGMGIKVEAGATYAVMDNIGLTGTIEYSGGVPGIEAETRGLPGAGASREYSFSQLGFKVLAAPRFTVLDLVDMYLGTGIGIFFSYSSIDAAQQAGAIQYAATIEQRNRPSLGFLAQAGIDIPVADFAFLFGEFSVSAMSVTQTRWQVNESNFPQDHPFAAGRTEFEKDDTVRFPPPRIPASNFTIRIGTRFAIL